MHLITELKMKQNSRDPEKEIANSTVTTRESNTFLPIINRISRQQVSKEIEDVDITTNQFDPLSVIRYPNQQK